LPTPCRTHTPSPPTKTHHRPPLTLTRAFQDFRVQRVLGEGALSTVVHATCARSGLPVAVKMYHRERLGALNARQVAREVAIHAACLHPHVARLFAAFEDADGVYLVQELAVRGALLLVVGGLVAVF
jgi:aurora kinase